MSDELENDVISRDEAIKSIEAKMALYHRILDNQIANGVNRILTAETEGALNLLSWCKSTLASLRARPQEPGLFTKRLLDEIIDSILEGSDADNPTLCLEEFRDSILNLAPSGPLSDEPRENENQDVAAPSVGELEWDAVNEEYGAGLGNRVDVVIDDARIGKATFTLGTAGTTWNERERGQRSRKRSDGRRSQSLRQLFAAHPFGGSGMKRWLSTPMR